MKVNTKFNDDTIPAPVQLNKCVWQGCGLSPTLLNVHINKTVWEFKMMINKGIQLTGR